MDRLLLATLNIRNLADRWPERQSLIYADMAALQPDVLALQEVVYVMQQDRLIGASGEGRYVTHRGWAGRPEYGNSLLVKEPLRGLDEDRLDLGLNRSAHRVTIELSDGVRVTAVSVHLHHPPDAQAERDDQTRQLIDWLEDGPTVGALLVLGDFNADPREPAYGRMHAAGFRSAYAEANGEEPAVTWPSGLVAPAIDTDGDPDCLDYIWVRGNAVVGSCRLVFDRPDPGDVGLYPSDHFGLAATIRIG